MKTNRNMNTNTRVDTSIHTATNTITITMITSTTDAPVAAVRTKWNQKGTKVWECRQLFFTH